MKIRNYIFVFFVAFSTTFFLASCLNEENKIPPNCYDGILNNNEEKIDCGGPCEECDHCENGIWNPERGETWRDCGGRCPECAPCSNGILDQGEAAIDCGGLTCQPCNQLCNDGLLNGSEQEVDCGGSDCEPCPTCSDGEFNGDEWGIDCGGSAEGCPPCTTTGNCGNGVIDGNEYWVDCGGSHCEACEDLFTWKIGTVTHNVPDPVGSIAGSIFNTTGTSLALGSMSILITATAPFANGQTFTANPGSSPLIVVTYTNPAGVMYSSAYTGSSLNISVQRYVFIDNTPPAADVTYVRYTFSGTLRSEDGLSSVLIQSGLYANLF
jgi:hypothetical protein